VVGKVIVAKAIGIFILYIGIIRFVINWTGEKEWLNEQKSISYSSKFNLIKWPELDEDIQLGDAEQKFVICIKLSRGSFKTYSNYYSTENESFGFRL